MLDRRRERGELPLQRVALREIQDAAAVQRDRLHPLRRGAVDVDDRFAPAGKAEADPRMVAFAHRHVNLRRRLAEERQCDRHVVRREVPEEVGVERSMLAPGQPRRAHGISAEAGQERMVEVDVADEEHEVAGCGGDAPRVDGGGRERLLDEDMLACR